MNRAQAVDLANVIHWIRPDWQQPGIITALTPLDATYPAACLHAIRTATNPASRTPAAITAQPVPDDDQGRAQRELDQRYDEIQTRTQQVASCPHCDDRGYQANGWRCPHDGLTPDERTARARAHTAAARAAISRPPVPANADSSGGPPA